MLFGYSKIAILNKKACYILGFFVFCNFLNSQNQKSSDSLEIIFSQGNYKEHEKLKIIKQLAVNETDTKKKLKYSTLLIKTAKELDSVDYLFQGYLEKGNALRLKSDHSHALESYFQGAKIATKKKLKNRLGTIYISIADVYSIIGKHKNSVTYYKAAITILKKEKDSINIGSALLNLGDEYINSGELKAALTQTKEAENIFNTIKYSIGQAYCLGNLGMIYAKLGNDSQAIKNINKAIIILKKSGEYYPVSVYLTYMSDIYLEKGDKIAALNYATKSLEIAKKYGLKKEISDSNFKLSELYSGIGDYNKSLGFYKNYIIFRDSVNNIKTVQQIADMRADYEVSQKQIEVDLLNQQKKNQKIIAIASVILMVLILLIAVGLYRRYQFIKKTKTIIELEKSRSDSLLLNILPEETAQELKQNGKVLAKKFESVTVLFTDFVGFTQYAENLTPEELVKNVDYYFSKFDLIIEKFGLEKIKTIGDSYMCAGGLPFETNDHALKTVQAAFEIASIIKDAKTNNASQIPFDIRIGINTGPVVAGVVGTKKFAYDIWGDTVNIASRMESNSEVGKINVSENTFHYIKQVFQCEFRGEIQVKNRGVLKMYFVTEK